MRAGKLNNRVTIQRPVKVPAGYMPGDQEWGPTPGWQDLATVWAELEPRLSAEATVAKGVQGGAGYTVTIRHMPGITSRNRILLDGRVFEITSAINVGERRREIQIEAQEIQTDTQ